MQQGERAGVLAAVDMPVRVDETGADETARRVERLHAAGRITAVREDGFDFFAVAENVCAETAERSGSMTVPPEMKSFDMMNPPSLSYEIEYMAVNPS